MASFPFIEAIHPSFYPPLQTSHLATKLRTTLSPPQRHLADESYNKSLFKIESFSGEDQVLRMLLQPAAVLDRFHQVGHIYFFYLSIYLSIYLYTGQSTCKYCGARPPPPQMHTSNDTISFNKPI